MESRSLFWGGAHVISFVHTRDEKTCQNMGIMQHIYNIYIYDSSSALYFVPGSRNLNQPAFHGSTDFLPSFFPTGPRAMSQVATVPLPPPIESFVVPRLFEKKAQGVGFKHFSCSPLVGEDFQFDYNIFSDGLKPPTRKLAPFLERVR